MLRCLFRCFLSFYGITSFGNFGSLGIPMSSQASFNATQYPPYSVWSLCILSAIRSSSSSLTASASYPTDTMSSRGTVETIAYPSLRDSSSFILSRSFSGSPLSGCEQIYSVHSFNSVIISIYYLKDNLHQSICQTGSITPI